MRTVQPYPIDLYTTDELVKELRRRCDGMVFVGQWRSGRLSLSGSVSTSIRVMTPKTDRQKVNLRRALYEASRQLGPPDSKGRNGKANTSD